MVFGVSFLWFLDAAKHFRRFAEELLADSDAPLEMADAERCHEGAMDFSGQSEAQRVVIAGVRTSTSFFFFVNQYYLYIA